MPGVGCRGMYHAAPPAADHQQPESQSPWRQAVAHAHPGGMVMLDAASCFSFVLVQLDKLFKYEMSCILTPALPIPHLLTGAVCCNACHILPKLNYANLLV